MSARELVVLGSSSAVPTKRRNHNGYFLRWDANGLLFDPGEGTQRQFRRAGLAAHDITRICVTHFHGDHSLGIPGIVQRIARDGVDHEVRAAFPAAGEHYWRRLRHATAFADTEVIVEQPLSGGLVSLHGDSGITVTARPLEHRIETYGYRIAEPGGWRMLPDELARRGVAGPDIGRLQREGEIRTTAGERVRLAECAAPRRGQVAAFVMDTVPCANAVRLAQNADLLVVEATYLEDEAALAAEYRHLTASQAGRLAAEADVRTMVLTHISERYGEDDDARFIAEAAGHFDGEIVLASDLERIAVPRRR